jgi:hypothetical protein
MMERYVESCREKVILVEAETMAFSFMSSSSWAWWCTTLVPGTRREEDCEF